jgi:hypothetical protein
MKKFLAIAIIVTALGACNNSSESSATSDTSTTVTPDTMAPAPAPDTTHVDTSASKMDTSAKK